MIDIDFFHQIYVDKTFKNALGNNNISKVKDNVFFYRVFCDKIFSEIYKYIDKEILLNQINDDDKLSIINYVNIKLGE